MLCPGLREIEEAVVNPTWLQCSQAKEVDQWYIPAGLLKFLFELSGFYRAQRFYCVKSAGEILKRTFILKKTELFLSKPVYKI